MDEVSTLTYIVIVGAVIWGIIFGAFCAYLAKQKNRDSGAWFALGFLFSLIALIAIAASPKAKVKLKGYKAIIRFCLIFLGLLIVLTTTFPFLSDKFNSQLTWLMVVTADLTGSVLKLFGLAVNISGRVVRLNNFSMEVVGECTGLYEMLIFLAAMIAYPASYKKKLIGAGLGLPLLYVINVIRMVFISIIGNWSPKSFDFMHMYFWQVAMILIIVSVWVLWIEKVVHYPKSGSVG